MKRDPERNPLSHPWGRALALAPAGRDNLASGSAWALGWDSERSHTVLLTRASAQLSSKWVTDALSKAKMAFPAFSVNLFQSGFLTFGINASVGSISR